MLALAILATAVTLLLERAASTRVSDTVMLAQRDLWPLIARKMAELELDPAVFNIDQGGGSGSGDFSDYGQEYQEFSYSYAVLKEEVATNDPQKPQEKPKEILKLTLTVQFPVGSEIGEHQVVGFFPIPEKQATP